MYTTSHLSFDQFFSYLVSYFSLIMIILYQLISYYRSYVPFCLLITDLLYEWKMTLSSIFQLYCCYWLYCTWVPL